MNVIGYILKRVSDGKYLIKDMHGIQTFEAPIHEKSKLQMFSDLITARNVQKYWDGYGAFFKTNVFPLYEGEPVKEEVSK